MTHHALLGGVLLALDTIISQAFGAALLQECRGAMVHGLYIASPLTPVITAATFAIIEILPRCGLTPRARPVATRRLT